MCDKNLKVFSRIVLITGVLLGAAGCGSMPSQLIQKEKATVSIVGNAAADGMERNNPETETAFAMERRDIEEKLKGNEGNCASLDEVEAVDLPKFGRPKEVLDNIEITSNVEVIKTEADELQIEFELENVGLCTFVASKGKELALPDEVFLDSTKIKWTATTADGEYIFPYMRVNETGDMFLVGWAYHGYSFALYGKPPQKASDRDMAGKVALTMIYNLSGENK